MDGQNRRLASVRGIMRDANRRIMRIGFIVWVALGIPCLPSRSKGQAYAGEEEFVELVIPLREGKYYSVRDFRKECNRKLGAQYDLESQPDREIELTPFERAALLLANESDLVRSSISDDCLRISIPNSENDAVRRRNRKRLERLFGVAALEWPADKGLHLPAGFDPKRPAVLLIHGLEADRDDLEDLADACRRYGQQPLIFDYPNDGPLAWSGDRLSDELRAFSEKYPKVRLTVIAHSMGGLVARYCLETPGKNADVVSDFFLLGVPNHGSRMAAGQEWLELFFSVKAGKTSAKDLIEDGLGEGADDLLPDSEFLRKLNSRRRPKETNYHVAIGSRSPLAEADRKAISRELERILSENPKGRKILREALRLLAGDELADGRGDGAVSISSARLEDVDETRIFSATHGNLLHVKQQSGQESEIVRWIAEIAGWRPEGAP